MYADDKVNTCLFTKCCFRSLDEDLVATYVREMRDDFTGFGNETIVVMSKVDMGELCRKMDPSKHAYRQYVHKKLQYKHVPLGYTTYHFLFLRCRV